jgi:alpha-L-rhamnosidase
MTSFNHYALGAVVDFLHRVVAGLAPAAPGYRKILVRPMPGGGLSFASARHITPYGTAEVTWRRSGRQLETTVQVPCGSTADVQLPGQQLIEVGAGTHSFATECRSAGDEAAA